MHRPRVTIHNLSSLDGQLTSFPVNLGLYYQTAAQLPQQAVLTTSATLVDAAAREGIDLAGEDPNDPVEPPVADDPRPWLVIVDGRGRLPRLGWLRGQPFCVTCWSCAVSPPRPNTWTGSAATTSSTWSSASSRSTWPPPCTSWLPAMGCGRCAPTAAAPSQRATVRAGLVDELSVVLAPQLAGADQARAVHLVEGIAGAEAPQLTLVSVERLAESHLWLRYSVTAS